MFRLQLARHCVKFTLTRHGIVVIGTIEDGDLPMVTLYLLGAVNEQLQRSHFDIRNIQVQTKLGEKLLQNTSFGERCGIVMAIVLVAGTNPIIIDQPEDNLDGKYVSNVLVPLIRDQKSKRQIILVTRDASLVPVADAHIQARAPPPGWLLAPWVKISGRESPESAGRGPMAAGKIYNVGCARQASWESLCRTRLTLTRAIANAALAISCLRTLSMYIPNCSLFSPAHINPRA